MRRDIDWHFRRWILARNVYIIRFRTIFLIFVFLIASFWSLCSPAYANCLSNRATCREISNWNHYLIYVRRLFSIHWSCLGDISPRSYLLLPSYFSPCFLWLYVCIIRSRDWTLNVNTFTNLCTKHIGYCSVGQSRIHNFGLNLPAIADCLAWLHSSRLLFSLTTAAVEEITEQF